MYNVTALCHYGDEYHDSKVMKLDGIGEFILSAILYDYIVSNWLRPMVHILTIVEPILTHASILMNDG